MPILQHFTAWLHVTEAIRILGLRPHTRSRGILLGVAVGDLDWSVSKGLEDGLGVGGGAWLVALLLLRVFTTVVDLREGVAVSDHHAVVV